MRPPIRVLVGYVSALTLAAWATGAALLAQGSGTAGQARMPDGHPDLQGTYDAATMTPLERPAALGTRLVLTPEEARAIESQQAERTEQGSEPSAADRAAPPVGGDRSPTSSYLEQVFRAGGGVVGGYNLFWIAPGTELATINGEKRSSVVIDPPDGRVPPMKAGARERNQQILARRASPDAAEGAPAGPASAYDDPEARPLSERCILGFGSTSGPPSLPNYWYNNLKQIVQTPDSVTILNEMVHDARVIRVGGTHLPPTVRRWMGDSIGHWEGDTLVVDTTNFTDKTQFRGSSENLHVVERFTRMADGNILYHFTVDDPTTWDRPWSGEYPWRATSDLIYEYACHEGNYSLTGVLRGAREAEKEAAEQKKY